LKRRIIPIFFAITPVRMIFTPYQCRGPPSTIAKRAYVPTLFF
jgi:hypothetical protein